MMAQSQTDENSAVIRRFFAEVYNGARLDALDELIAPAYRDYGHTPPGVGLEGARQDAQGLYTGFDQIHYDIDDLVAVGDQVWVRWTGHVRQIGPFFGVAPTGKSVTYQGMSVYRVQDGKIIETRNLQDLFSIFQQLGAYPTERVG